MERNPILSCHLDYYPYQPSLLGSYRWAAAHCWRRLHSPTDLAFNFMVPDLSELPLHQEGFFLPFFQQLQWVLPTHSFLFKYPPLFPTPSTDSPASSFSRELEKGQNSQLSIPPLQPTILQPSIIYIPLHPPATPTLCLAVCQAPHAWNMDTN